MLPSDVLMVPVPAKTVDHLKDAVPQLTVLSPLEKNVPALSADGWTRMDTIPFVFLY
ncbi:hypothetical protein D3C71_2172450 [compost metagenome]